MEWNRTASGADSTPTTPTIHIDELKEIILRNLAGLSDVERTVISERFALGKIASPDAALPKTLEQVGTIIGVTKERVRQIQNNALKKIRVALEDRFLAA